MNAPCKDCAKRHTGCHSTCEKYREWEIDHKAKREVISRKKLEDRKYRDYKVNQIIKTSKR